MGYALQAGLSVCLSDGRPVFLDLSKDRYFCLSGAEEQCLLRLLDGAEPMADDKPQIDRLLSGGILSEQSAATALLACRALPPTMSLFDLVDARFHGLQVGSLLAGIATASVALKYQALARSMSKLKARKAQIPATAALNHDLQLRTIVEAFRWSGLVMSTHDRCLSRSIALSRHLARRRIAHSFVFGVTLRPFRAHCWIEHDQVVLTDKLDTVLNFTPILVI